jgi:predicted SAM-dependent methyltransferase
MDRKEKILKHIDKNGYGIEIGPSYNPVAPKSAGYKVHIIDHMNRKQLIEKYKGHDVNTKRIENVDFVWRGENYQELTRKTKYYDWIIASHVIEHTPDLIGFLNDCDSILKNVGVLSLVVPDKRYCFDHYRPITNISKIIDNHLNKCTNHTAGSVAEYFLNVVSKSGNISWDASTNGEYKFIHSRENALQGMKTVINDNAYLDIHAWCFVPHSFRLIVYDLFCLGLTSLKEVCFLQTEGFEFFVTLGRNGQGPNLSRNEMLEIIESEIMVGSENNKKIFKTFFNFGNLIQRLKRRSNSFRG